MGRRLLALLLFSSMLVACNETGPNDPVVKPADMKQAENSRLTPEEQSRRTPPPAGGHKR